MCRQRKVGYTLILGFLNKLVSYIVLQTPNLGLLQKKKEEIEPSAFGELSKKDISDKEQLLHLSFMSQISEDDQIVPKQPISEELDMKCFLVANDFGSSLKLYTTIYAKKQNLENSPVEYKQTLQAG